MDAVRRIAAGRAPERVLIAGDAGSGKTHLLEAASAVASAGGDAVAFVPMREWCAHRVDAVRGLGRSGLLCIDDIDEIAGDRAWEEALLALIEASASRQGPTARERRRLAFEHPVRARRSALAAERGDPVPPARAG